MVKSALRIEALRIGPGQIEVRLTPREVTHAVPTGDLFRRLMLSAEPQPSGRRALRYLGRHHVRTKHDQRVEVSDDRPHLGTTVVSRDVGVDAAR